MHAMKTDPRVFGKSISRQNVAGCSYLRTAIDARGKRNIWIEITSASINQRAQRRIRSRSPRRAVAGNEKDGHSGICRERSLKVVDLRGRRIGAEAVIGAEFSVAVKHSCVAIRQTRYLKP